MVLFLLLLDNQSDEAEFLSELYHANYRLTYGTALKVLRHPQDAEDAVQTVMLKLIQKTHLLRTLNGNKLASYLVISTRNTAISLYRQNKARNQRQEELVIEVVPADVRTGPEEQVLSQEKMECLLAAIDRLPPRERDSLMLRYMQGLNDSEIADTLGIAIVSARALLSKGRKKLREMLKEGGR